MRFIKSNPDEFLVLGRRGRLRNLGPAASRWRWPGDSCVRVSGAKQEACFAMTQESRDGIPLRFKGFVLYRVVDPVAAVTAFDFASRAGHAQMQALVEHVCLGALRDVVSRLAMQDCIEERKASLSSAVEEALARIAEGEGGRSWGIAVDVVQVSQVYIVDDELRSRLETERRNEVVAQAERSNLQQAEAMKLAHLESERRTAEATFEQEREASQRERQRLQLEHEVVKARIETDAQVAQHRDAASLQQEEERELARRASARRIDTQALDDERAAHEVQRERLELEQTRASDRAAADAAMQESALTAERGTLALQLEVQELRGRLAVLETDTDMVAERARATLERELLPQRQVPEVAHALASMLQGAEIALYGADNALTETLGPLVSLLGRQLAGSSTADGRAS